MPRLYGSNQISICVWLLWVEINLEQRKVQNLWPAGPSTLPLATSFCRKAVRGFECAAREYLYGWEDHLPQKVCRCIPGLFSLAAWEEKLCPREIKFLRAMELFVSTSSRDFKRTAGYMQHFGKLIMWIANYFQLINVANNSWFFSCSGILFLPMLQYFVFHATRICFY